MIRNNSMPYREPLAMKTSPVNLEDGNKTTVTVCVGSSCHLRGSYEIIQCLRDMITSHALEREVALKGSFCMENCTEGVNVKINEELFSIGSVDEMKEIFQDKVASILDK